MLSNTQLKEQMTKKFIETFASRTENQYNIPDTLMKRFDDLTPLTAEQLDEVINDLKVLSENFHSEIAKSSALTTKRDQYATAAKVSSVVAISGAALVVVPPLALLAVLTLLTAGLTGVTSAIKASLITMDISNKERDAYEQMLTSMKDTLDDASHQMVSIEIPEKNIYQKKNKQSSEKNMDTSAEPYSSGDFTIANLEENLIKKSQGDDGKFTNASVPTANRANL